WSVMTASGGIVVFVGLWMEKRFDKESYRDVADLRACKSLRKWGWRILMFGITAEIGLGFVFAYNDAREIKQSKPENQRIQAITAQAYFFVRGTNLNIPLVDEGLWSVTTTGLETTEL